jgi:hypothetical protein
MYQATKLSECKWFIFQVFILLSFALVRAQSLPERFLAKPSVDDDTKYTTTGNIGVTITNFGTFGDGFRQQFPVDQPSCIYPKGSGIEHLFVGGLWVGAQTPAGVKVTTGAFNTARLGGAGSINFEFTNTDQATDRVIERSSLYENKYYSPFAISHQDFIANFNDTNTFVPGTSVPIPYHIPMGISVHLETYAWNYPFADAFVIFNYTIQNVKQDTLRDVYVGLWADLVVRNVNITPPRVGSPFYLHAGVGYKDEPGLKLVYCYDYDGDPGYTDSYIAMTFLGAEPLKNDQQYKGEVFHNWWLFSGGDADEDRAPSDEASRYERMRRSMSENYFKNAIYQKPGNRMSLITTGPFAEIPPDSSINVVFALVCAKKAGTNPSTIDDEYAKTNLYENVGWAYRAYFGEDYNRNGRLDYVGTDSTEDINGNGKLDRYVLPTPPIAPYLKVVPENSRVVLYWDDRAERSIDLISKKRDFEGYRIYRSLLGDDLRGQGGITSNLGLIAEFDLIDGIFYDTGLDSIRLAQPFQEVIQTEKGVDTITFCYRYIIDNLHNGWQYAFSVTAFDSGDVALKLNSMECSQLQNLTIVSPGTPAKVAGEKREIGVYPNPYRVNALWDGSFERERKLYFYNLPLNCEIRIYTLAGDLVDKFQHHGNNYNGTEIKWYQNYSLGNTVFAGGEHAWNLISTNDQAIASGLYIFTVEDLDNGKIYRGKFLVIK